LPPQPHGSELLFLPPFALGGEGGALDFGVKLELAFEELFQLRLGLDAE